MSARRDRRIGDALAVDLLGAETMDVFRALWPPERPQQVIARCLLEERIGFEDALWYFDRLLRLRLALGAAHCPRVLQIYGRGDTPLACLEEDAGDVSFHSLMKRRRAPLPVSLALHLARAVVACWCDLDAIGRAKGTLLTPSDVRIGWDGRVRLLVCPSEGPPKEDDPTRAAQTADGPALRWFSPEAIRGLDRAESPMFGVGMMLFESLSGQYPFETTSMLDFLAKVLDDELPRTLEAMDDITPSLAGLVRRLAEKSAERRFASWPELSLALDSAARGAGPASAGELAELLADTFPAECDEAQRREAEYPSDTRDVRARLDALPDDGLTPMTLGPDPYVDGTRTVPVSPRRRPHGEAAPPLPVVRGGSDRRPMVRVGPTLLVDQRPVTRADYARFLEATAQAPPRSLGDSWAPSQTLTRVSLAEAEAYACWAGKRIPTSDEWELAIRHAGAAALDVGLIWELTSDERGADGWVVRGGPWRDGADERGREGNLSHSDVAPDVGFRCIADE